MPEQKIVSLTSIESAAHSGDGEWITLTTKAKDGTQFKLDMPHNGLGETMVLLMNIARKAYEKRLSLGITDSIPSGQLKPFLVMEFVTGVLKDDSMITLRLVTSGGLECDFAIPTNIAPDLIESLSDCLTKCTDSTQSTRH